MDRASEIQQFQIDYGGASHDKATPTDSSWVLPNVFP